MHILAALATWASNSTALNLPGPEGALRVHHGSELEGQMGRHSAGSLRCREVDFKGKLEGCRVEQPKACKFDSIISSATFIPLSFAPEPGSARRYTAPPMRGLGVQAGF